MAGRNTKAMLAATAAAGAALAVQEVMRRRRRYEFRDKVVVITGGSRGLGLVLAQTLARERARLVLCARDPEELLRAQDRLVGYGAQVFTVPCDVTDRQDIHDMVERVAERFGPIDVLVNNASTIQVGPGETMTIEDYEEAMKIHFWAPLHAILEVVPGMKSRGHGRIVNISSIGGKISVPHLLPYSASKFALTGLSEGLRAELMKDGILVTTVCPGLMRTGSPRNAFFKGKRDAEYAWFALADNTPGLSVSAEQAAYEIIEAARYGEAELTIGKPARIAALLHGMFPGLTADMMAVANRLLPAANGNTASARGHESESKWTRSVLGAGNRAAAERYNEV